MNLIWDPFDDFEEFDPAGPRPRKTPEPVAEDKIDPPSDWSSLGGLHP
jgi:hypothetical protein